MDDPGRVAHVRLAARRLREANQYAILAAPWLLFPLERAFAMQGMERFLMNLAGNPEFAQALLLKIAGLCKTLMGTSWQRWVRTWISSRSATTWAPRTGCLRRRACTGPC